MEKHVEKLKDLMSNCNVAMLGAFEEMRMIFRPMAHVDVDDLGNIWFFVDMNAEVTAQINANPNVYINYACEKEDTYITIEGVANISNVNRDKIRELYSPAVKTWFPGGADDPNLGLLIVHPLEIDYWENNESKVLTYIKLLAGAGTTAVERGKLVR
jgi:general stress protein 26